MSGNRIKYHRPNWSAPNTVFALTTTLSGGVSDGVYASMNLGGHVGDDRIKVDRNRDLLKCDLSLPNEPVWLNQVHGIDLCDLSSEGSSRNIYTADGSYTLSPGRVCAILTADCMPVFLTTKSGDRVALLHAGWRSLAGGIIERGVEQLACAPEDIIAWAGPCIGPDCFEIGDEVRTQLGGDARAYKPSDQSTSANVKWYADLYRLAGERLASVGVKKYTHSVACTYRDHSDFFSYRRTGQCGRMASLIWFQV